MNENENRFKLPIKPESLNPEQRTILGGYKLARKLLEENYKEGWTGDYRDTYGDLKLGKVSRLADMLCREYMNTITFEEDVKGCLYLKDPSVCLAYLEEASNYLGNLLRDVCEDMFNVYEVSPCDRLSLPLEKLFGPTREEWLERQLEETKELLHKVGRGDADSVLKRKYNELALKEAHSNVVEELGQKDIPSKSAPDFLQAGIEAMNDRAVSRDNESERSMAKTVRAFNALTGRKLSEREGWLFMVCLKLARANNGKKTVEDDFIDGAAYMALYGECAVNRFEECEADFVGPKVLPDELAELEEKLKTERSEFVPKKEEQAPPPKGYPRAGSRVRFGNIAGEFWGTVYYPSSGECKVRPDNKPKFSFPFKQLNVLEVVPPPRT